MANPTGISPDDIMNPAPTAGISPNDIISPAAQTPAPQEAAPQEAAPQEAAPIPSKVSPDDIAENNTQNDEGTLARLADYAKKAEIMGVGAFLTSVPGSTEVIKSLTGPGTTSNYISGEGANTFKKELSDMPKQTMRQSWEEQKQDIGKILDTGAVIPYNAADPEWAAKHPHVAAAAQGLSDQVKGLTSPESIALILGTSGMGAWPKILEEAMAGSETLAPYAPKAAIVARRALQGVGAYFTYQQIHAVAQASPEFMQAILTGQTDKAIEIGTGMLVNATMGGLAAKHTAADVHQYSLERAETNALKDPQYNEEVHRRGNEFTVAGGTQDAIKQIADKSIWKNAEDRRAVTHHVEANQDPKVLAERQKEAATAPPSVDDLIAGQGPQIPFGENKPVATNGSGESAASQEAVNRVQAEKTNGIQRYRVDTRSGVETPIANTTDAVDLKAQPFEEIRQRGPEGDTLIDRGDKAKPFTPKPIQATTAAVTPAEEKEPGVHDLGEINEPEKANQITYRTDDNGTKWAKDPTSPAEVSIPKDMTDEAEIEKYAREKIDLQKQFAASRKPALTPATETNANTPSVAEEQTGALKEENKTADRVQNESEIPEEEANTPMGQHLLELRAALKDASDAAKAHVITPEERAERIKLLDPKRKFTPEQQKDIDYTKSVMDRLGKEAVKRGLLKKGQLRGNFVPHEYPFEDKTNPTRARLYNTLHDAYQAGLLPSNDDFFALAHDYIGKMTRMINDYDTAKNMKAGRALDGRPLAVSGGFVEGQRVSSDRPQSYIIGDDELKSLTKSGKLAKLIRAGHVVQNPDKSFTMKAEDFVQADGLKELRPIGPTPIPPNILESMKADGSLDALLKKGLLYKNDKGEYITKEPLYARTPLYINPNQAPHFNGALIPVAATPKGVLGKTLKFYDDAAGNVKSLLLSWSPFHRLTEAWRALQGMGIIKGGKTVVLQLAGRIPDIDYQHLTPNQAAAFRDGITNGVDPRGGSESMAGEGVSAGGEKNWGAKTYKIFNKGLEKLGIPESIRSKIDPEKILTKGVFGPQGQIVKYKIALYDDKKPLIAEQIAKDHPEWSKQEVDVQAGRLAAQFANNLFGGQNLPLIGRALEDQKFLRRVLLAPDFLESTGRSIADISNKYGGNLAAKFIEFNLIHAATAAAINYVIHHDPNDHSAKGALDASHIIDHPFQIVSPDGSTVYGLRTEIEDFLHLLDQPREFITDRINPLARAAYETYTKRNQYGRRETQLEAAKSIPKAMLPIQVQNLVGLGPNTTTEPSVGEQFMKSLGIQARPNRTPAEQLAIDKVSARLEGEEALQGPALARAQMRFNIEDRLRAANQIKDPEKKKAAVAKVNQDLQMLVSRKIVDPQARKNIVTDAQGSRLKSIFVHMGYPDALDIWDKASDQEKEDLGTAMQAHYSSFLEKLSRQGQSVGNLDVDNQKILDRFKNARNQLTTIRQQEEQKQEDENQKAAQKEAQEGAFSPNDIQQPALKSAEVPYTPAFRSAKELAPIVDIASKKYGVAPDLIDAMIRQESGGDANAVSAKGAIGLMQLLPSVAEQYGVKDIHNPEENIEGGVHYMADLLKRYDGDEQKALAAYNAGPDAVEKYNGVPPYKETRNYVKSIQNRPGNLNGVSPDEIEGAKQ